MLTTKWVSFYNKKITCNSIIVLFSEEGPQFYIVHAIIINQNNEFQIVVRYLYNVNFDEHYHTYEIDVQFFSWDVLTSKNVTEASLSSIHKAPDGHYILKKWM